MNIREIEKKVRTPAIWTLGLSIIVSLTILIIYFIQSGLSEEADDVLFLLLALLRYSSFLVCICSIYLLAVSVVRIFRRPSVIIAVQIILFLCSALYGTGIILIDTFILSITAGNG